MREKIKRLRQMLKSCTLCPRRCKVNRLGGKKGYCGAGKYARVCSFSPHFGEESVLVGRNGSGTIFFSFCNLKCVFCQNYEISHLAEGRDLKKEELAECMLKLESMGCHNLNLVTPTHFLPQILEALELAIERGFNLPLVYNCGGYESEEVIDLLQGVVDIYMPDAKFSSPKVSEELCNAPDYFENLKKILKKMHRQVGDLELKAGIAQKGLLLRHLVMPDGLAGSQEIMRFIKEELSQNTYINIMAQYRPCGQAQRFPKINRMITSDELNQAVEIARSFGLQRFA